MAQRSLPSILLLGLAGLTFWLLALGGSGAAQGGMGLGMKGPAPRGFFSLNAIAAGSQRSLDLALLPEGGFVGIWETREEDEALSTLWLRRFDAQGFGVTEETSLAQGSRPAVAVAPGGSEIRLVWRTSEGGAATGRFDLEGRSLAEVEALVPGCSPQPSCGEVSGADVAISAGGRVAVAWERQAGDRAAGAFVRLFEEGGDTTTWELTPQGGARDPSLLFTPEGDLLVAWQDGEDSRDLWLQRFGAAGEPLGLPQSGLGAEPLKIEPPGDGRFPEGRPYLRRPSLAALSSREIAVVWDSGPPEPELDLGLCLEGSGAVRPELYDFQLEAAAQALSDPDVVPQDRSVRVTAEIFADRAIDVLGPLRVFTEDATADAVAVVSNPRPRGSSCLSCCIERIADLLARVRPQTLESSLIVSTVGYPTGSSRVSTISSQSAHFLAADEALAAAGMAQSDGLDTLNGILLPDPLAPPPNPVPPCLQQTGPPPCRLPPIAERFAFLEELAFGPAGQPDRGFVEGLSWGDLGRQELGPRETEMWIETVRRTVQAGLDPQGTRVALGQYRPVDPQLGPFQIVEQLNSFIEADQAEPAVAIAAGGTRLVAWRDRGQTRVIGRWLSEEGLILGDEVVIYRTRSGVGISPGQDRPPRNPQALALPDGRVLVAWEGLEGENPERSDLFARFLEPVGASACGGAGALCLGGRFEVAPQLADPLSRPRQIGPDHGLIPLRDRSGPAALVGLRRDCGEDECPTLEGGLARRVRSAKQALIERSWREPSRPRPTLSALELRDAGALIELVDRCAHRGELWVEVHGEVETGLLSVADRLDGALHVVDPGRGVRLPGGGSRVTLPCDSAR